MSDVKSLAELQQLANSYSIDKLRDLVSRNLELTGQIQFGVSIYPADLERLDKGGRCLMWGIDPSTGKSKCLKWEDR